MPDYHCTIHVSDDMFRTQEFKDIVADLIDDIINRRYDYVTETDVAEIARDVCEDHDYSNGGRLEDLRSDLEDIGGQVDTNDETIREIKWELASLHEDWVHLFERVNDMSRPWYVKLWYYFGSKWSHVTDVFRGVN